MWRTTWWGRNTVILLTTTVIVWAGSGDTARTAEVGDAPMAATEDTEAHKTSSLETRPDWGLLYFFEWPDDTSRSHRLKRIKVTLAGKEAFPWGWAFVGEKPLVYETEEARVLEAFEHFLRHPLRRAVGENLDWTVGYTTVGRMALTTNKEEFMIFITEGAFLLRDDAPNLSRMFYSWGLAHFLDDLCWREAGTHIQPTIMSNLTGEARMEQDRKAYEALNEQTGGNAP